MKGCFPLGHPPMTQPCTDYPPGSTAPVKSLKAATLPSARRSACSSVGPGGSYRCSMAELPLPDPPLRSDSLALRAWTATDVPALVAACQDPLIARFAAAVPSPYDEADARAWLASQDPARHAGSRVELAVVSVESGDLLGSRQGPSPRLGRLRSALGPASIAHPRRVRSTPAFGCCYPRIANLIAGDSTSLEGTC